MNKVEVNYTSSRLFTSKIHNFENLPEPRNATEEEQEVNDFKSNEQNSSKSSKVITIFRDDKKEKTQKYVDDDDDLYNNPNLHSNEQDELEIPDDGF
ncbi:unnamed protein product [Rhizophagus irregularis]|nr:unnamed protein product [Rhizophagus irregularis]